MPDDEVDYDETSNEACDSGPFCQHWSDPADCTKKCAACSHECREHGGYDPRECRECLCPSFEDESDESEDV